MNTVLIVDADPVERNLVTRYLRDAGYWVLEAANSAEAVRIAGLFEGEIDLAIVANPDVLDTAKEIIKVRTTLPILVASRHAEGQGSLNSLHGTVNFAFLQKPFIPVVLLDRVRELIRRT